jgi:hypothetical protein
MPNEHMADGLYAVRRFDEHDLVGRMRAGAEAEARRYERQAAITSRANASESRFIVDPRIGSNGAMFQATSPAA